ncbi:hypothetical protein [Streptomyces sp. NPDC053048]|uniref:hypothetical protein n=1 Tax=Streptomyces sp. NPDC053048 TaxID=3365694 RepID=UPI0037CE3D14
MALSFKLARVRRTALMAGAATVLAASAGTFTSVTSASAQTSSESAAAFAPRDCPYGYFCGYKKPNFKELKFRFKDCYLQEIPDGLTGKGSWYNNQTEGTVAIMYGEHKEFVYATPGAPSSDKNGNWRPIWYIDAC